MPLLDKEAFGKRHETCPSLEHVAESFHLELTELLGSLQLPVPKPIWERVDLVKPLEDCLPGKKKRKHCSRS